MLTIQLRSTRLQRRRPVGGKVVPPCDILEQGEGIQTAAEPSAGFYSKTQTAETPAGPISRGEGGRHEEASQAWRHSAWFPACEPLEVRHQRRLKLDLRQLLPHAAGACILMMGFTMGCTPPDLEVTPAYVFEAPSEALECRGVRVPSTVDLQKSLDRHDAGTTFCVSGAHRVTTQIEPQDGQRLVGQDGAVFDGSQPLTKWHEGAGIWVVRSQSQGPTVNHEGSFPDFLHEEARYSDDVFYDGALLERVNSKKELGSGHFYFDYDKDHIYIADSPIGHTVELAVADGIVGGEASRVAVKNLTVQKSLGRGVTAGSGWSVTGSEIRLNATTGMKLGDNGTARHNFLHHNGQYGLTGAGDNIVVEENEISFNNSHRYYNAIGRNWASVGTKFVLTGSPSEPGSGLVLRDNYSHENWGDGLWTDINNIHTLIEGNTVTNNERYGIRHEISYDATIRNNTVSENTAAGIVINSSPNVEVYGNNVWRNGDGIEVLDQDRGTGPYGPYVTEGLDLHDNEIVSNLEASS